MKGVSAILGRTTIHVVWNVSSELERLTALVFLSFFSSLRFSRKCNEGKTLSFEVKDKNFSLMWVEDVEGSKERERRLRVAMRWDCSLSLSGYDSLSSFGLSIFKPLGGLYTQRDPSSAPVHSIHCCRDEFHAISALVIQRVW